ncbi:Hypothetical predicted protein [Cloeon dipterum]|uniref:Trafficking protein particle complex subunit 11 n=1 Tax=Cloeon dipterum TaxID=197152 RepID=A0A8S1CRB2_9INSE|nr:Hypothetical predicted protein [Cloeon dipterum]
MAQCSGELFDVPGELSSKAHTFIGLSGLDTLNNATHRAIWDAFTNNRRHDKVSVHYKLFPPEHVFPTAKPKRNTYEWYIPKGILKRNWMNKYLNVVPSVVVIFYDLDWFDPFWNEKKIECASRVQSVRAALEGRTTRIAVVLIQTGPPIPAGDESITAERAATLCTTCELNAKNLFLLPHNDHLHGYTLRLENAFYDLAQSFYNQKVRTVRGHRDHLNKTTHQYLFVRHQFKMGFLNELKHDATAASKHYAQAYSHLLDVRVVDTNTLEVKTVAAYINYKLCRIAFNQNLPRDAIAQFRKHIDLFKNMVGPKEISFEHHAWLSKQFCVFGELFDEAIHHGLPAVQTQHPGIYFHQAAQHSMDRKNACLENCQDINIYPQPDPLDGLEDLEFYGQRPWRPGKLSAEPADAVKEKEAIQALQFKEKSVNHSMIIISLLGSAISQAKTYRCPRTRRQLVVQMAEEYYHAKDFKKALTLLSHMLWEFRGEQWSLLMTNVLLKALECVYHSPSVTEFVTLAIEAQSSTVLMQQEEKAVLLENIFRLLKGEPPIVPENIQVGANYGKVWRASFAASNESKPITVEMTNATSFLETKTSFGHSSFQEDKSTSLKIWIRNKCSQKVSICRSTVTVSSPTNSTELQLVPAIETVPYTLEPHTIGEFGCSFSAKQEDVGKEFTISSVNLCLGQKLDESILLRFSAQNNPQTFTNPTELVQFGFNAKELRQFQDQEQLLSCSVCPREAHLSAKIENEGPALLGEWFPVQLHLENNENGPISSVVIKISLMQPNGKELDQATHLCLNPMAEVISPPPIMIELDKLDVNSSCSYTFHLKSLRVGQKSLVIDITYILNESTKCERIENLDIEIVKPFEAVAKFFTQKFDQVTKAYSQEPFVVLLELKCLSPWSLAIEDTNLELVQPLQNVGKTCQSQLQNEVLNTGEVGTEAYCVLAEKESEQPVSVGMYTIRWRRKNTPKEMVTSSSITLPALLKVDPAPLLVEMELPAHGWVGSPMAASVNICNRTSQLLEVELNLQASDAFMFAGQKQLKLRLVPETVHTLCYNLYPLLSGLVALPQLKLSPADSSSELRANQLAELLERSLPTHIYVMPRAKGKSDIST